MAQTAAHQAGESEKLGTLRGGSSGCIVGKETIGKCTRKSLARYFGISEPKDESSQYFFDAGYANEETWLTKLKLSWDGVILCEEEIPINWVVPGTSVPVTGRPDTVLCDADSKPILGLELKAILAINSAVGVAIEDKPKTDHVIQAAHYSWQLGIPFILVYTWNVRGQAPYWAKKKFGVDTLQPGQREYHLGWEDGKLHYIKQNGTRIDTQITQQGIEDYYRLIADMAAKRQLYRRPADIDETGARLPWNGCSYCPFKSACDDYENDDFDMWLDAMRLISEEG